MLAHKRASARKGARGINVMEIVQKRTFSALHRGHDAKWNTYVEEMSAANGTIQAGDALDGSFYTLLPQYLPLEFQIYSYLVSDFADQRVAYNSD